eukprot:CAMPEP_0180768258 /NCGR_PEP_ID=MMETSP1038_2-20121128/40468_1 /TAXON_ID=632150 /ORGANISM="Azadinium spinosum, Strain 3D9" /LENGTH=295 /DNA_ID=CAMNT_0022802895 /DNA_START=39 /DNA_END=923 /DNA_ORIENTATION=-
MESCKAKCEQNRWCKSVDFKTSNGECGLGDCQIGDGECENDHDTNFQYSTCTTSPSLSPSPSWSVPMGCRWRPDYAGSIVGHNIKAPVTGHTIKSCQAECEKTPGCQSIDWRSRGSGECSLKDCQIETKECKWSGRMGFRYSSCDLVELGHSARCKWTEVMTGRLRRTRNHRLEYLGTGFTMESCKAKCNMDRHCKSLDFKISTGYCTLSKACAVGDNICEFEDDETDYQYTSCGPVVIFDPDKCVGSNKAFACPGGWGCKTVETFQREQGDAYCKLSRETCHRYWDHPGCNGLC